MESGGRTWAEVAASELKRRKEDAAECRPLPIHAGLQLEQRVMRLEGAANARHLDPQAGKLEILFSLFSLSQVYLFLVKKSQLGL